MFLEPLSEKNTESQIVPLEDGEPMELSDTSKLQEDTLDTSSETSLTSEPKRKKRTVKAKDERSSIAESVHTNKKTILKDKKNPSKKVIRNMKSSKTSVPVSTLKEGVCCEWSTPYSRDLSKKLLLRTGIDSVGSPSTFLNGFVKEGNVSSWFKTKSWGLPNRNSQKISWPSSMFSPVNSMDQEDTRKVKARKIRLKPQKQQAMVLRKWVESSRKTYNEALKLIKETKIKPTLLLNKLVVTSRETDKGSRLEKMKSTPADVRKSGVRSLITAFKSAKIVTTNRLKNIKAGKLKIKKKRKKKRFAGRRRFKNKKPFEVKFKSKRMTSDSFELQTKSIKFEGSRVQLFSTEKKYALDIEMSEPFSEEDGIHKPSKMCKFSYCFGRWYIIIPEDVDVPEVPVFKEEPRIVGIDPGLRTAFTCVSNKGDIFEYGIDPLVQVKRINKKGHGILERMKEQSCPKRKSKLRRAWYRVNARAKNLVADLHWKTIKHLVDNFDVIVIGKIGVQSLMSMKKQSLTNKKAFSFLSHYEFRQRLKYKAGLSSKVVIEQDESYTSQNCFRCDNLKKDLGANKTYNCSKCKLVFDRDMNSCFNIMVRCASEHFRESGVKRSRG